jgi:tetratricopeptide (TPR) repeat protein
MRKSTLAAIAVVLACASLPTLACDYCIKGRQKFRATTAALVEGMGRHHHPVSTPTQEAQCFFDQGMTYCFAFNHDEAVRSFKRAAELDSSLAMAYWGVAYALGTNYNIPVDSAREIEAYQNIQKALALAQYAWPAERDYINALAARYTSDPNPNYAALDTAYKEAMKTLYQKYPDDEDAAVLYAESAMNLRPWMLWEVGGDSAPGTLEIVEVLESVLKRDPLHTGANHFYIHAVEASPQPERALAAAYHLGGLAPAAGHLVHMPGHAFMRTGNYEESIKANHEAVIVDSTYIAAGGGSGFYSLLYYPHNIHFLSVSYALDGQYERAVHYADMLNSVAGPTYSLDPHIEGVGPTKLYILTKFRKWNAILTEPAPDTNLKVLTAIWHYARGMAFAATGKADKARKELSAFDKAQAQFSKDAFLGAINAAKVVIPIPRLLLTARIAEAENKPEEAVKALYEAAKIQDGLAYDEPEAWYIASRETLGALLVKLGRLDEAEKVFREDLARYPRNGRSLFGLMTALQKANKSYEAAMVEQEFNRAWARSDTQLQLEDL